MNRKNTKIIAIGSIKVGAGKSACSTIFFRFFRRISSISCKTKYL
ncbi:hypothetical protein [Borreliella afzelii]